MAAEVCPLPTDGEISRLIELCCGGNQNPKYFNGELLSTANTTSNYQAYRHFVESQWSTVARNKDGQNVAISRFQDVLNLAKEVLRGDTWDLILHRLKGEHSDQIKCASSLNLVATLMSMVQTGELANRVALTNRLDWKREAPQSAISLQEATKEYFDEKQILGCEGIDLRRISTSGA
jgi:hypothetical protein